MGDKNFRLPTWVRPERYDFTVVPDLAAKSFRAEGSIVLVLDRPAQAVTMHGVHLAIERAQVGEENPAAVTSDADAQTLTFTLQKELAPGKHDLEVVYSGKLHDDLRGFYLAGGVGVTQFEAADARRVFPCFDEPSFKAVWALALEGDEKLAMISNGEIEAVESLPDGRKRVLFRETPKLSSYLVALVIGDLKPSQSKINRWVAIRTWAVPAKLPLTAFAQECATNALELLEDYFDRKYAFGKLDQIGIPDFEAGAMENAGCITFREVALLLEEAKAPLSMKKRVAEVVTHELAHQWFGNLVTMQWWDDLWLNEAFATWMAYKVVDAWKPEWRMWDDFELGKASALYLDSLESTHPIHSEVHNADEATENFDAITYEKGGAMLRMLEGFLGEEPFRDGIRAYIRQHAFANATADDLWNALARASDQPIGEVAHAWLGQSGYPLVSVERDLIFVKLRQQRFFSDPTAFQKGSTDRWLVPVVLKWADDSGVHETRHLLRSEHEEVTLEAKGELKFVFANAGAAGFYRVRYTPAGVAELKASAALLSPVEKVNLVADAWALFRAGAGPLETVLELVQAFASDTDYTVLGELVSRLDALDRRCLADADRPAFQALVAKLFTPQLAQVGFDAKADEDDATKLRRAQIIRALALIARVPEVAQEAASRLEKFFAGDAKALDPNLLDVASIASARLGDPLQFHRFTERARTETDPASKRRAIQALAAFEHPGLFLRAANLLLGDTIAMQDAAIYLGGLLANRAAQPTVWKWLQESWTEVRQKTAAPMLTRRVVEAMGELVDRRAEVEAFLDAHADSLAAAPQAIRQTRERLRLDEDVKRRAGPALSAWLKR